VWFPGCGLFPSGGGGRATQKEEQITQIVPDRIFEFVCRIPR